MENSTNIVSGTIPTRSAKKRRSIRKPSKIVKAINNTESKNFPTPIIKQEYAWDFSTDVNTENIELIQNYSAPILSAPFIKKEFPWEPSTAVNDLWNTKLVHNFPAPTIKQEYPLVSSADENTMENTEMIWNSPAPAESNQPIKRSTFKPSTIVSEMQNAEILNIPAQTIKVEYPWEPSTVINAIENTEMIWNCPAPTESGQPIKRSTSKPSTIVSAMENVDILKNIPAQTIKVEDPWEPSTVINAIQNIEIIQNSSAPIQRAQPIKKECASTVVNAIGNNDIIWNCPTSTQPIKKRSTRKPSKFVKTIDKTDIHNFPAANIKLEYASTVVKAMENAEVIQNCPAPTQSIQPMKRRSTRIPSKVVNAMAKNFTAPTIKIERACESPIEVNVVVNSEIIQNPPAPTQSAEPSQKKSARKSSTVEKVVANGEVIRNCPAPTESALPSKRRSTRKPSKVVNAMSSNIPAQTIKIERACEPPLEVNVVVNSEIIQNPPAPTQSAEPIKKKSARKSSTVVNGMANREVIPNCPAPTQSAQRSKNESACIPSAEELNAMEDLEMINSSTVPTSTVVDAVQIPVAIENDTAPTLSARRKKKKSRKHRNKFKAPRSVIIPVASETLDYEGSIFTRGDIVSVVGEDDRVYYAQIHGFLKSQYCEKFAVLTWLLPTTQSPKGKFDPDTYIIGHQEDIPRGLEYLEFVCHAPNEYYKCSDPSYADAYIEQMKNPVLGFAETSKGYVYVKLPFKDFSTDSK